MRRRVAQDSFFVGPLIAVTLLFTIGYFGHHAVWGARGLQKQASIHQEAVRLQSELDELRAAREVWARRVNLLKADSIDPDMLDERARAELWLAQPGEIIVPLPAEAPGD